MNNLQKLKVLTDILEVQENEFIDYVIKAEYAIILVSAAGRIKWCNDFFTDLFGYNLEEINNKGLKRILGIDVLNIEQKRLSLQVNNNNTSFLIKQSELTRKGKLIHKKITLIPDE
jgi:PAS domain-containing protein